MRFAYAAIIILGAACGSALGQRAVASTSVPLSTFTDVKGSVSFQYPSVWRRVRQFDDFSPSAAFAEKLKPEAVFQFTGAGNYYEKTDLASLAFEYGSFHGASAQSCRKLADDLADSEHKVSDRQINGVTFRHSSSGGSSTGHGIDSDVYTTFRNGTCFVFEEDFATADVEGTRELKPAEIKALQRHLGGIMQSVKLLH